MRNLLDYVIRKYQLADYIIQRKVMVLTGVSFLFFVLNIITLFFESATGDISSIVGLMRIGILTLLLLTLLVTQRGYINFGVNTFILYIALNSIYFIMAEYYWLIVLFVPLMFLLVNIVHTKMFQFYSLVVIVLGNFLYLLLQKGTIFEEPYNEINIALMFMVISILFIYLFVMIVQKEVLESRQVIDKSTVDFVLKVNNRRMIDLDINKDELKDTVSILMIGINGLSNVNEKDTKSEINNILKDIMGTVRSTVRLDDYIIRWGQTEFLLILNYTRLSNCGVVGEKIRKALEFKSFGSSKARITTTICATAKNEESGIQEAIDRAVSGLDKARQENKRSVVFP